MWRWHLLCKEKNTIIVVKISQIVWSNNSVEVIYDECVRYACCLIIYYVWRLYVTNVHKSISRYRLAEMCETLSDANALASIATRDDLKRCNCM